MSEKIKYRTNVFPKKNSSEITVFDLQAQYVQNPDTWDDDQDGIQTLSIKAHSVTGSPEGEHFFTISTERWAFDDIDELIRTLEDFKKRL